MKKLLVILSVLIVVGCKKDPPIETPNGKYEAGMIVLNEGLFQQNNASISFYSFAESKVYQQVFFAENNRGLGDTANDMDVWINGDSTYLIVAVDVSSQIEIINASTMQSVAQIPIFNGAIAREPREVIVFGDKAYSCNYDGTVTVIDLLNKAISNTIAVGSNPDGMDIAGNNLYVSNSGGLNFPVYDSTVSVIDLNSETELMKIPTRINCTAVLSDNQGDIYVISNGNYSNIQPAMLRIDTQSNTVTDSTLISITSWTFYNDWIYYYEENLQGIYRYDTQNESFENVQLIDCSSYQTMYGIYVNDSGIFTTDANGFVNSSTIRTYTLGGAFQYKYTAGLNANKLVFN
jgi:Domain of unknown function (DUF5074)